MVVTSAPSFITARVRHELIGRPSTRTVQAPHWPWSQPFLVPVRSRCGAQVEQGRPGATVSLRSTPLTCSVTAILVGVGNRSACLRTDGDRCAINSLASLKDVRSKCQCGRVGRAHGATLSTVMCEGNCAKLFPEARCKALGKSVAVT